MTLTSPSLKTLVILAVALIFNLTASAQQNGQPTDKQELKAFVLKQDSLFWQAYNNCDLEKFRTFFSDDLEFYHDNGGLTSGITDFMSSVEKNMCGNKNWRLRREAIGSTIQVFPMANYGALVTGEHLFYVTENGKETLDGLAKFSNLWQYHNGKWKMTRIFSYDHGPAPATAANRK